MNWMDSRLSLIDVGNERKWNQGLLLDCSLNWMGTAVTY